jgi:hypothetical protein
MSCSCGFIKSYNKYWEDNSNVIPYLANENSIQTTNQIWQYTHHLLIGNKVSGHTYTSTY